MSNYNNFYEHIDRKEVYSSNNDMESHPVTKSLRAMISKYSLENKKFLEVGSGNGRYQDIVEDYTGIDISESARQFYHKPYFVTNDKTKYPFDDKSIDCIFTKTVFEHIPDMQYALDEVDRVLKKDGILYFKPAWNCRPWAADGYQVRPYSDFNLFGKIYKFFIPLRNHIIYRSLHTFPKRFIYLLLFMINKDIFKKEMFYKKIKANYETYWQSDSDACNNMEPFLSILYFKSNGYEVLNYPTLLKQFFIKNGEVILKKK
mgnify:CR=1 FL=1